MRRTMAIVGWALPLALLLAPVARAGEVQVERQGYSLQAETQGDGPLTVVFESGFAQGGGVWQDVIAKLGGECRCITYARAAAKTVRG